MIKGPPVAKTALRSVSLTDKILYGSAEAEKNAERIMEVVLRRIASSNMGSIKLLVPGRSLFSKKSKFVSACIVSLTCYSRHAGAKPIRSYGQKNVSTIQVLII